MFYFSSWYISDKKGKSQHFKKPKLINVNAPGSKTQLQIFRDIAKVQFVLRTLYLGVNKCNREESDTRQDNDKQGEL